MVEKLAPLYLIVYDVTDNKERGRVDKVLHGYGFRVQKSVYECHLTRGQKQQIIAKLEALAVTTGHIRLYSVNSNHVIKIGDVPVDFDGEYVYFID